MIETSHGLIVDTPGLIDLNIDEIRNGISKSETLMKVGASGDHINIFWGFSGVGKSSTILTLSGEQMIGYVDQKYDSLVLMNKNQDNDIRIENAARSGTSVPAVVELARFTANQQVVKLWDMPGFGDIGHDITRAFINNYYIHRIFALHSKVKLVFVVAADQISLKQSQSLRLTLQALMGTLGDFKMYQNSMMMVVTKTKKSFQVQHVKNLFKQHLQQTMREQSKDLKDFIKLICKGSIPIVTIANPDVQQPLGFYTPLNPKNVTDQYKNLIKDFYDKTIHLKPTSFPTLRMPVLTPEQVAQSLRFAQQIKQNLNSQVNNIVKEIGPFVQRKIGQLTISKSSNQAKENYARKQKLTDFCKSLFMITDNKDKNFGPLTKENYLSKHISLKQLFQKENYLTIHQRCQPMQNMYNLLILTYFFSTFSFGQTKSNNLYWLVDNYAIENFFTNIQGLKVNVYKIIQNRQKIIIKQIEDTFKSSLIDHVNNLEKETAYQSWLKTFYSIPCYTLKIYEFHKNKDNLKLYLEEIKEASKMLTINTDHVDKMLNMIEYNKTNLTCELNDNSVIKQLTEVAEERSRTLIEKATDYRSWDQQQNQQAFIPVEQFDKIIIDENNRLKNQIATVKQLNKDLQRKNLMCCKFWKFSCC